METLDTEFDQAIRNVTISGVKRGRAIAAHTEVRALLEADPELGSWGIDSILIGSYARQTARYPGKDVDIFLRLTNLSVRHDPEKVYNAVERVLIARYGLKDRDGGGRVTRQARSLKIDFPDPDDDLSDNSFSIDAVPAVPWGKNWGIPNRDRDLWNSEEKRWIKTNPVEFADDTNSLAVATWTPTIGTANAYRPVVRLLRQVRHVHFGKQRPGGLFTEVAVYYSWKDQLVTGATWAELLTSTMEQVATRFEKCADEGLLDPVLSTPMKPELDSWEWTAAADGLNRLAEQARQALDSERCRAAKTWRDILGSNDRGQVLPLPDGCDANGFPVGKVTAVGAVGSNDPRGFASPPWATRRNT
ncbi:nucleotidyltransferase domain-containing protein [Rathayibacter sp. VKM Ac-2754]|uniref:nucleotidyltransferase domain-containing protein n=1 Tax=Rathayibacter sp. VKM Ac-2754 TaxID=2609251 RepID=UPI00135AF998|nr:nucleotidyltransferase [Rathayibacter sp. VKM Ac-2754]MWV57780.1 nucleotidyltransferase [Rathayibacter sp. VKM Ac-2754]